MTKQEQIIEKVYSLLPELKKKEFGCEVEYKGIECTILKMFENHLSFFVATIMTEDLGVKDLSFKKRIDIEKKDIKIIGQKISLASLLKAYIEINNEPNGLSEMFDIKKILNVWNFSISDNLKDQLKANPELTEFLFKIFDLKKEKIEWRCVCNMTLPDCGTKTVDGYIRCQECKRIYTLDGILIEN